jgi:signal transduction histidine kinase
VTPINMRAGFKVLSAFIISTFLCLQVYGQQSEIDSLKNILEHNTQQDTNRVNTLNRMAFDYYSVNIQQLKYYSNQALQLSLKLKFLKGEAFAYKNIGLGYLGSNANAMTLVYFDKSLNIFKRLNDKSNSARMLNNMGYFYGRIKDHEQERKYIFQALSEMKGLKRPEIESIMLGNIGNSYEAINEFVKAREYYDKSLRLVTNQPDYLITAHANLASVNLRLKNYQLAQKYADTALGMISKYKDYRPKDLVMVYLTLGQLNYEQKNYNKSRDFFEKSRLIANKIGNAEDIIQIYHGYYLLDSVKGDFKSALHNYYEYSKLNDSLSNGNKNRMVAFYQLNSDLQKRATENERLRIEEEKNQTIINHQRVVQIILSISLIIIIISIAYLVRINNRMNKQNKVINDQNQVLENNGIVKDKLFSVISHDLRSPITQVIGLLNLWEAGEMNQEEMSVLTPAVKGSIVHTLELLDNLLIWSKNQLQGFNFNPLPFDLKYVVDENLISLQGLISNKNLIVENSVLPNSIVNADKEMIKIVLRNLISNAIKFTPQMGSIRIKNTMKDGFVVIEVEDSGIGIKERDQSKIFSFTSHTTLGTANEKGTGIGLKICKDFIELNNGSIWMESKENVGSRFFISIPVNMTFN